MLMRADWALLFAIAFLASLLPISFSTTCRTLSTSSTSQVHCYNELTGANETYFSSPTGSKSSCLKADVSTSIFCFGFAHGSATSMGCFNLSSRTHFHNYSTVPGDRVDCGVSPNGNTVCYAIETQISATKASIYKICTKTSDGEFIFHDDRGSPDDSSYDQDLAIIQGASLTVFLTDTSQCFSVGSPNYNGYDYICFLGSPSREDVSFGATLFMGGPSDFFQSTDRFTYVALYNGKGLYCSGTRVTIRLPPWQNRGSAYCGQQGPATDLKLAFNITSERTFCFAAASGISEFGCTYRESGNFSILATNLTGFNVTDIRLSPNEDMACAAFGGPNSTQFFCANLTDFDLGYWATILSHNISMAATKVSILFSSSQPVACFGSAGSSGTSLVCFDHYLSLTLPIHTTRSFPASDMTISFNSRGDIVPPHSSFLQHATVPYLKYPFPIALELWNRTTLSSSDSILSVSSPIDLFPANLLKTNFAKVISATILRVPQGLTVQTSTLVLSDKATVTVEGDLSVPIGNPTNPTTLLISGSVLNITQSFTVSPNVVINIAKPDTAIYIAGNASIPVGSALNYSYSPNSLAISRAPIIIQGCADLAGNLTIHLDTLPNETRVDILSSVSCAIKHDFSLIEVVYENQPCYQVQRARAQVINNTFGAVWNADFLCSGSFLGLSFPLLSLVSGILYVM